MRLKYLLHVDAVVALEVVAVVAGFLYNLKSRFIFCRKDADVSRGPWVSKPGVSIAPWSADVSAGPWVVGSRALPGAGAVPSSFDASAKPIMSSRSLFGGGMDKESMSCIKQYNKLVMQKVINPFNCIHIPNKYVYNILIKSINY